MIQTKLISVQVRLPLLDISNKLPLSKEGELDMNHFKKIAAHGTHDIFVLKDECPNNTLVLKVMRDTIDTPKTEIQRRHHLFTSTYTTTYRLFGDACMPEHHLIVTLIDEDIKGSRQAIVSVQAFEPSLHEGNRIGLHIKPTAVDHTLFKEHGNQVKALDDYAFGFSDIFDQEALERVDPHLNKILGRCKENRSFREEVTNFLRSYSDFHLQTTFHMDITGFDNVFLYQTEDETWKLKIGSVLKEPLMRDIDKFIKDFLRSPEAFCQKGFHGVRVSNLYVTTRALNLLARQLGLPPVITDDNFDPSSVEKMRGLSAHIKDEVLIYHANKGEMGKVTEILENLRFRDITQEVRTKIIVVKRAWKFRDKYPNYEEETHFKQLVQYVKEFSKSFNISKRMETSKTLEEMLAHSISLGLTDETEFLKDFIQKLNAFTV